MQHRRWLAVAASTVAFLGSGAAQAAAQDREVVGVLQDLIRLNTSNPPGNEQAVAEYLSAKLQPLGFQVEIVPTPAAGKAHFIARLPATAPDGRKPLLIAGHSDVVGVERPLWTVDPFAGVIQGDRIYGRGAMDFKGGLAAFTVAAMRLARENPARTRDLILLWRPTRRAAPTGPPGWPRTTGPRSTPRTPSTRAAGSSRAAAAGRS